MSCAKFRQFCSGLYVWIAPTQIAKFMGPTCGPPGSCRPQMGPMLAPWTLPLGYVSYHVHFTSGTRVTATSHFNIMAALVHRVGMVCVLLLAVSAGTIESSTLKLGIMGDNRTGWTEFYFSFTTLGGAVPIAVDAINQNSSILPNYTIEVVYGITNCNDRLSLVTLIELEQNYDVDAIIGPQCSSECLASGLLASQWNIPIITPVCSTNDLSTFAESKYDTFMRVTGANHVGKALAVIAHHLGWDHIAIIQPSYVKEPRVYVADSMENACEEFNISVIRENLYTPNQRDTIRLALENVMYRARSMFFVVYHVTSLSSTIHIHVPTLLHMK